MPRRPGCFRGCLEEGILSKEYEAARAADETSPEERQAALRESLPGLLFGLFTLILAAVGVVLLISTTFL